MRTTKLFILLLLFVSAVSVYGQTLWDEALQVDSTDALGEYWTFSGMPSPEVQMALMRAGGSETLSVRLDILVLEDGSVQVRVAEPSGNDEYDRAAVAATEQFEYEPTAANEQRQPVVAPFEWNHGR